MGKIGQKFEGQRRKKCWLITYSGGLNSIGG